VTFRVLESFRADYRRLPRKIQERVDSALTKLEADPRHPSLQVKKMRGTRNIWEGRVSLSHRFTFQWEGNVVILRRVGSHSILEKESR
jgi:mRNA interferase RelE/StbE